METHFVYYVQNVFVVVRIKASVYPYFKIKSLLID